MKTIDCYFWMNSDWAYLGADRLEALARRQGAAIRYLPVDLPEVCAAPAESCWASVRPSVRPTGWRNWRAWCRKLGIRVNPPAGPYVPDAGLARASSSPRARPAYQWRRCTRAILKAEWCDERDISDEATLRAILREQGLDDVALLAAAAWPDAEAAYRRNTDAAVAAGRVRLARVCLPGRALLGARTGWTCWRRRWQA